MSRFFAVGDIHGCSRTLGRLLEIIDLQPGDTLLSTGDLSAKGEDSQGVHEQFVELEAAGVEVIVLLGNHEAMLLAIQQLVGADVDLTAFPEAIFEEAAVSFLIRSNEAWATIKSYGFERAEDPKLWAFRNKDPARHFETVAPQLRELDWKLPPSHLSLLQRCRTHHLDRNCLFVHSGLQPHLLELSSAQDAVNAQLRDDTRAFCWSRDGLGMSPAFPELLVHGHTPLCYLYSKIPDTSPWQDVDLVFKSVIHNGALNLDSGVFLESGHLTAVEVPEDGNPSKFHFIRVPRIDPVCKDRLWHLDYM